MHLKIIHPSPIVWLTALTLLILNAQPSAARAQGTAFTYQGRLDTGTNPAAGLYDMTFELYNASTGGAAVAGPVTNSAVGVTNGLFTVIVDFGSNIVTAGEIDTSNWLQIAVETNGGGDFTTLAPRQQLTPAPFATYAGDARMLAAGTALGAGAGNSISTSGSTYSFVGGGEGNTIQSNATMAVIGGGQSNIVSGQIATAGGGQNNIVTGFGATVAGGVQNDASGDYAFVGGGGRNSAQRYDVVGGGLANVIGADYSGIFSGEGNTISEFLNSSLWSIIGGGRTNQIGGNSPNCAIVGGQQNFISGSAGWSFIGGGTNNIVEATYAIVGGGQANSVQAGASGAFVGGGLSNNASGFAPTVAGGVQNTAGGGYSFVGGGQGNSITGNPGGSWCFIGAGQNNEAINGIVDAVIGGGSNNSVQIGLLPGNGSFIGGGQNNRAIGANQTVAGGINNTAMDAEGSENGGATVGGGATNSALGGCATVAGGYNNVASASYSTVGGGVANNVLGIGSFIGGGGTDGSFTAGNIINDANGATLSGGLNNYIESGATGAVVGGGYNNDAGGIGSFIGGGGYTDWNPPTSTLSGNTNLGNFAVIGGGLINRVLIGADYAAIGGGLYNTATGEYATIPGGATNQAAGNSSFAAGSNAVANTDNTFVWSDGSQLLGFTSTANNQFLILASGGVGIGTASPDETLSVNGSADKQGGGSWDTFSDARLKDIGPNWTRGLAALDSIRPVQYHYKTENALKLSHEPEYVGVIAQQVQDVIPEAVHRGKNGYLVVNNDPIIWTMVNAIKELKAENETLKRQVSENVRLQSQMTDMQLQLNGLQAAVARFGAKSTNLLTVDADAQVRK